MPDDRLDAVLDVAREVLLDYGASTGASRIERLARWLAASLQPDVRVTRSGAMAVFETERVKVLRAGDKIGVAIAGSRDYTADEARAIATAFLLAAEAVESEHD